jgi:hypothetical protein
MVRILLSALDRSLIDVGNEGRQSRPPAEQESMGARNQIGPAQDALTSFATKERRGGREGEVIYLRRGRQCEGCQGPTDCSRRILIHVHWRKLHRQGRS